MGNLGNALTVKRDFAAAEPLLREAMDGRRRVQGNEAIATLTSLNTYGTLLITQGQITQPSRTGARPTRLQGVCLVRNIPNRSSSPRTWAGS